MCVGGAGGGEWLMAVCMEPQISSSYDKCGLRPRNCDPALAQPGSALTRACSPERAAGRRKSEHILV